MKRILRVIALALPITVSAACHADSIDPFTTPVTDMCLRNFSLDLSDPAAAAYEQQACLNRMQQQQIAREQMEALERLQRQQLENAGRIRCKRDYLFPDQVVCGPDY